VSCGRLQVVSGTSRSEIRSGQPTLVAEVARRMYSVGGGQIATRWSPGSA
jgi:hypothetical protein